MFKETKDTKEFRSEDYNYIFKKKTGEFARWGKTPNDDPSFAPFPEIWDMEISTICHGINGKVCDFCYKGNTSNGSYMKFETFKKIFDKFPKELTQIAFGIGDLDSNIDMFKIFKYCRKNKRTEIIPNVTINGWGLTKKIAKQLKKYCGAVAISCYDPKDVCYDAVKLLTDIGMKQINIHYMLAEETYNNAVQTMIDIAQDKRLKKLNAIVFLSVKQKGRAEQNGYTPLDFKKFKILVQDALRHNVSIGFDSCTCPKFLQAVKFHPNYENFRIMSDPCESSLFSCYSDVWGEVYPCSFLESEEYFVGNLLEVEFSEIWKRLDFFRQRLLNSKDDLHNRVCPIYKI